MTKRKFKYSEIIKTLEVECPPKDFESKETIAFRWVFDTMNEEINFSPQYFKNPARFQNKPPTIKCKSVGLSFFSTEESARIRFKILTARMLKSVRIKIGKKIATSIILETDGVIDLPDRNGHFTLHTFTIYFWQQKVNFFRKIDKFIHLVDIPCSPTARRE